MTIPTIPHKFIPRPYQLPIFQAMNSGFKRSVLVWHRRAGKDKALINVIATEMIKRVGVYYYFFPTYTQGKKILWKGIDKDGMPFLDHFPVEVLKPNGKNESTMSIEFNNGSYFQIIGTDKYDSIRGTNPVGCVFSEFSYQDPRAWDICKKILDENGGWAIFNFTPQGKNHGYDIFTIAGDRPDWFRQLLTVDDTKDAKGKRIISQAIIDKGRKEGEVEDFIQQEWYCSFDAGIQGAYYSESIALAKKQGRWKLEGIYNPALPVYTVWDLGIGDCTAIWFVQVIGKEVRLIDYFENSGKGIYYYINYLDNLGYNYGDHFAPFDIEIRELISGVSRWEAARETVMYCESCEAVDRGNSDNCSDCGTKLKKLTGITFKIVPKLSIDDGIDAVRRLFPFMFFDIKCKPGQEALVQYRKEYDPKRQEYKLIPFHDWASHAADGIRYVAVAYNQFFVGEVIAGDDRETASMDQEF